MGYISQGDLVQNMSPEQRILVASFYTKFDIGSGVAHKKILNVEPIQYIGASGGTEFVTYAVTKMYLALHFSMGQYTLAEPLTITFYDENNAASYIGVNTIMAWDTTGVLMRYMNNEFIKNNFYFSRADGRQYLTFIGYRITLT